MKFYVHTGFILLYNTIALELTKEVKYCFWSKREYEISVGDAFDTNFDNYEKIDVSQQVLPNIEALAKYIIDKHNEQI